MGSDKDAGTAITGEPQWAMLGANPQRNGRSRFEGPSVVTRQQAVDLNDAMDMERATVLLSAVGPAGTLYAVLGDYFHFSEGWLVALDPDGGVAWIGEQSVFSTLLLTSAGQLFFEGLEGGPPQGSENVCFGMQVSGSVLWASSGLEQDYTYVGERYNAPMIDGLGNVYVYMWGRTAGGLDEDGWRLCSFDAAGALRWCWERIVGGEPLFVPPAMDDNGVLYVAVETADLNSFPEPDESADGLYALNPNGTERWFVRLADRRVRTLALDDDGNVYYAGDGAGVFLGAVDAGGAARWETPFPADYEHATASLAVAPSNAAHPEPTVYFGARHVVDAQLSEGALTAWTPDGVERWAVETGGAPCGGLSVDATGAVYALIYASEDTAEPPARLLGLEPTGDTRLSTEVADYLNRPLGCFPFLVAHYSTAPLLGDAGRVYFGSDIGAVHILSP